MSELWTTAEFAATGVIARNRLCPMWARGFSRGSASRPAAPCSSRPRSRRFAERRAASYRSGAIEVTIRTELTALDPAGRLFYRGHDAVDLARHRSFEDVAGLLWDEDPSAPWQLEQPDRTMIAAIRARLPDHAIATDLIPVATAALGATDPAPADRRPEATRRIAGRIAPARWPS